MVRCGGETHGEVPRLLRWDVSKPQIREAVRPQWKVGHRHQRRCRAENMIVYERWVRLGQLLDCKCEQPAAWSNQSQLRNLQSWCQGKIRSPRFKIIKNFRTATAEQYPKHGPFQAQSPGAAVVICSQRLGNRSSAKKLGLRGHDEFTESLSCWEVGGRNPAADLDYKADFGSAVMGWELASARPAWGQGGGSASRWDSQGMASAETEPTGDRDTKKCILRNWFTWWRGLAGWKLRQGPMLQAHGWNSFSPETQFLLLKLSTDWTRPTQIISGHPEFKPEDGGC